MSTRTALQQRYGSVRFHHVYGTCTVFWPSRLSAAQSSPLLVFFGPLLIPAKQSSAIPTPWVLRSSILLPRRSARPQPITPAPRREQALSSGLSKECDGAHNLCDGHAAQSMVTGYLRKRGQIKQDHPYSSSANISIVVLSASIPYAPAPFDHMQLCVGHPRTRTHRLSALVRFAPSAIPSPSVLQPSLWLPRSPGACNYCLRSGCHWQCYPNCYYSGCGGSVATGVGACS